MSTNMNAFYYLDKYEKFKFALYHQKQKFQRLFYKEYIQFNYTKIDNIVQAALIKVIHEKESQLITEYVYSVEIYRKT